MPAFAISETTIEVIAGTMAGISARFVEHPFDTVKTRLQDGCNTYASSRDCAWQTVRNEGVKALFRGISIPMAVSACETAVCFSAYSQALELCAPGAANAANTPLMAHAAAGGVGGLVAALVITPTELLKCRMQVSRQTPPRHILREFFRVPGWQYSLYQGHTATLAREIPGTAAWFFAYESAVKALLLRHRDPLRPQYVPTKDDLSNADLGLAGGIGGMVYWSAFFPADVVKTRMQLDDVCAKNGFARCLAGVYRKEGVRGLYKGYACTMLRAFPSHAMIFVTYEKVRKLLQASPRGSPADAGSGVMRA